MFIAGVKRRKYKEPKYKIGEMVYSYQNKKSTSRVEVDFLRKDNERLKNK